MMMHRNTMSSRRVQRIALAKCLLLVVAVAPVSGFVPSPSSSSSSSSSSFARCRQPTAVVMMSSTASPSSSSSSYHYPQLLEYASACANSDACSIDEAESYLREIFHAQSGCAAGTVAGAEICDDVVVISEIVSNLRRKITAGAGREVG